MSDDVKYPEIEVDLGDLQGPEGNAYWILGKVDKALYRAGIEKAERDKFHEEATSSDYDHLLATVRSWVVAY